MALCGNDEAGELYLLSVMAFLYNSILFSDYFCTDHTLMNTWLIAMKVDISQIKGMQGLENQ